MTSDYQRKLFKYCITKNAVRSLINIIITGMLLAALVIWLGLNGSTFSIGIVIIVILNLLTLALCIRRITRVFSTVDCNEGSSTSLPKSKDMLKSVAREALTDHISVPMTEAGLIIVIFGQLRRDAVYTGFALILAGSAISWISLFLKIKKRVRAD